MNSDLEEIKSRINIVDLVGEYLRIEKSGTNFRALCPFHNEKTPSFMVSEEKQIWHCFGCQKGGDAFGFLMEMEGLEFREALKILADKAGVELVKQKSDFTDNQKKDKEKIWEMLELATKFYETQLWKGSGKEKILGYLKDRGLSSEDIRSFRLGYAPRGWRNITQFLSGRGYSIADMKKTGLLVEKSGNREREAGNVDQVASCNPEYSGQDTNCYDRFRDRITFPIADINGKIVGFSARVAPGGDESQAKYVNTPETLVYHKSRILYGIEKAKGEMKRRNFVLLVEGNMDVIASHSAGLANTVAVSGTALTDEQLDIIKRYTKNIKMFFDMDSAGQSATKKSLELCFRKGISVWVVELPLGKDAADLAQNDKKLLIEAVNSAQSAFEYYLKKLTADFDPSSAEGKKKIAKDFLDMLSFSDNAIEKNHWIKILSEAVGVEEKLLTDMMKKVNLRDSGREYKKNSSDETGETILAKKADTLISELVGFMVVYPEVWRKYAEHEKIFLLGLEVPLIRKIIEQGAKAQFLYDRLIDSEGLDDGERKDLHNAFFKKKYFIDLNGEVTESVSEDPQKEVDFCLNEIKKEIKKGELDKISGDLKKAGESGDKESEKFLKIESQRIIQELASL